jgi:hypothetical protein
LFWSSLVSHPSRAVTSEMWRKILSLILIFIFILVDLFVSSLFYWERLQLNFMRLDSTFELTLKSTHWDQLYFFVVIGFCYNYEKNVNFIKKLNLSNYFCYFILHNGSIQKLTNINFDPKKSLALKYRIQS